MAAHMRCCRLHWRSHQALWEWGEIFWQDRDQGYARDLQEEQEDNWHGRSWVRCAIKKVNLSNFIVHLEDASTRLEPPQWCQHTARWPTFRCGTTFFPTSSCLRWKQGPAPVQFSVPGDRLRRVSRGQPGQLGENQLVPQLKSRHGLNLVFSSNHQPQYDCQFKYFCQARKETLDLERDVCRSRNLSLHMVPYKLKVKTERSFCTTSCYIPIFSCVWFTVWPREPTHVH